MIYISLQLQTQETCYVFYHSGSQLSRHKSGLVPGWAAEKSIHDAFYFEKITYFERLILDARFRFV